jgi:hypothetical protein|tara:strand:+ start:833 stop:1249 length:417 start_codon:yes stop_codon:yes gene_type:complete
VIKSRKFIAGLALFVAATAFVFTNHTDFTGWSDMMKWIFGIYVGGNVGAHTAAKVKLGNGHHPPVANGNGTPGVIIAQDDVHVTHTTPAPRTHVPISPNSPFQVRTMSGKDPEEIKADIEQEDPEGLEIPPPDKNERI